MPKSESSKVYDKKHFKYQTVLFKISELEDINHFCEENGIAKNTLVREAVMQYIGKPIRREGKGDRELCGKWGNYTKPCDSSKKFPFNLVSEIITDSDKVSQCVDIEHTLGYLLSTLPDKWGDMLILRYKDGLTLELISNRYGITKSRVGQVINQALQRLREEQNVNCLVLGIDAYSEMHRDEHLQKSIKRVNRNLYEISIEELNISGRAYNCLMKTGYNTIGKVAELSFEEILQLKNMGETAANEVIKKVKDYTNNQ